MYSNGERNMSESSKTPEEENSSICSESAARGNHDIGLRRLKIERDRITYAGKYMDRYKDEFNKKPLPPPRKNNALSARFKDIDGNIRPQSAPPSEAEDAGKSGRNVKLLEIIGSPVSESRKVIINSPVLSSKTNNATHELNKAENMSQLTSYKLVSDAKIKFKQSKSYDESPKMEKKTKKKNNDLNVYTVQPSQKPSTDLNHKFSASRGEPNLDTLNPLQQIENYISMCEAEAVKKQNLQKFDEILKKKNTNNLNGPLINKEHSQDIDLKQFEHIQEPLKSFNEVENLLRPGLSDMQAENAETFDRTDKTRNSTTGVQRNEVKLNVKLARASSDAQERVPIQRKKPVTKIRHHRVSSQDSQVFFALNIIFGANLIKS